MWQNKKEERENTKFFFTIRKISYAKLYENLFIYFVVCNIMKASMFGVHSNMYVLRLLSASDLPSKVEGGVGVQV